MEAPRPIKVYFWSMNTRVSLNESLSDNGSLFGIFCNPVPIIIVLRQGMKMEMNVRTKNNVDSIHFIRLVHSHGTV